MGEPIETIEGWYALHDFRRIDWTRWRGLTADAREEALGELSQLVEEWGRLPAEDGSFAMYSILGHKADVLFMHFRPDAAALGELEFQLDQCLVNTALTRPYSYFSVVELSKYLARGLSDEQARTTLRRRLEPAVPDLDYACFYPMNKRRSGADNWYMTTREERRELMRDHGIVGHKYHDAVIQVITGSQGLDDWEWGVDLFADDPTIFKKLIYEMRFDEASALYAEFGPFYISVRLPAAELGNWLAMEGA